MRNGCKSVFLLAAQATNDGKELDGRIVQQLAEKLVHFMEYYENLGDKIDPKKVAESLVRLMPCIKMVNIFL